MKRRRAHPVSLSCDIDVVLSYDYDENEMCVACSTVLQGVKKMHLRSISVDWAVFTLVSIAGVIGLLADALRTWL